MIRSEVYTIPASKSTRVTERTCDLCGRAAELPDDDRNGPNWTESRHEFERTSVGIAKGSSYPDGGQEETTSVDVCPDCFRTKLIPWLESQGAKPHTTEFDW